MKFQLSAFSYQLSAKYNCARNPAFLKAQSSKLKARPQAGFTLIEMLVSIALFAIVMVVCVGALLSLVGANKKAQALESTMNNLNISIDDMVRNMRQGSAYDASTGCSNPNSNGVPTDCIGGSTTMAFTTITGHRWVYEWSNSPALCGVQIGTAGCIARSVDGGRFSSLTAPEVSISSMIFYVYGTLSTDNIQPQVIITIKGSAGAAGSVKDSTTFHLQATAVQRELDL